MAPRFPLYIDLNGNNCIVFGGGEQAAERVKTLLRFGAKVTVIHPTLCGELRDLDKSGGIRYIPRRYYRGDCSTCYLCVAATDNDAVNIAISDECKAKSVAVNVVSPAAFGTFSFPAAATYESLAVSVASSEDEALAGRLCRYIHDEMPRILAELSKDSGS